MARIRSVHQGLFRDENFVLLSDSAQILLVGLGTHADDQGIFPWKPTTIKMELRPASTEPVEPLLAEMVAHNWVKRFTVNGREYGAIRNFRKHQRPKTPNAIHPITAEIRIWVALDAPISEMEDGKAPTFPPKVEMASQMEDGGVGEGVGGSPPKPPKGAERFGEFWKAYPHRGGLPDPEDAAREQFCAMVWSGEDPAAIIAGAELYARAVTESKTLPRHVERAFKWLAAYGWRCGVDGKPVPAGEAAKSRAALMDISPERRDWEMAVGSYRRTGEWRGRGGKPGSPEWIGPIDLLTDADRGEGVAA